MPRGPERQPRRCSRLHPGSSEGSAKRTFRGGIPLATRDSNILENADAVGLKLVEIRLGVSRPSRRKSVVQNPSLRLEACVTRLGPMRRFLANHC